MSVVESEKTGMAYNTAGRSLFMVDEQRCRMEAVWGGGGGGVIKLSASLMQ